MYCKKCGTMNGDSAAFCKQCGCQLNAPQADTGQAAPPPSGMPQAQPARQWNVQQNTRQSAPAKKSAKTAVILIGSAICILLLCAVAVLFKITGSLSDKNANTKPVANGGASGGSHTERDEKGNSSGGSHTENTDTEPASPRGTYMSVNESGGLKIKRVQLGDTPMGPDGTWTIFVYMCGSDLESGNQSHNGGFATADLQEMLDASTGDNIRFIIQTGGSAQWQNNVVSAGQLGRYEVYGGNIYTLEAQSDASMGDADTLSAFLEWGIEYAPAAKMGLVFWDHGGGSIVGVCLDTVNRDILTLAEIDSALTAVSEKMTDKFEFIGFDACLMATVECANMLSPYAEYMYASEEVEPGYGWDYKAIGTYLDQYPNAKGDALGKKVADSYYAQNHYSAMITFSVTDLSKIDDLVLCLNNYAKELNAVSRDYKTFSMVVRGILDADSFGNNNAEAGYTNMVDLAGITYAGAEYAGGAQDVLNAIDSAVVYSINGGIHADACGLSTYYPLAIAPNEINTFNNIAVCPYYMAFVARTAYAVEHGNDMSGYDEDEIVEVWAQIWGEKKPSAEAEHYWEVYEDTQATGNSLLFEFEIEPSYYDFSSDGKPEFGFLLTEESYYNLASVSTHAWKYLPEENILLDLGIRDAGWYKNFWDDTITCDATGGYHTHYLMDGQPFPQYKLIGNKYDNFYFDTSVYMTPVLLNGNPTYLLSGRNIGGTTTNEDGSPKMNPSETDFIWGAWACVSEDGTIDRSQIVEVHARDIITPVYHAIDRETGESFEYYGEEYKIPIPWFSGIFDCLKKRGKTVDGVLEEYIVYNFILTDIYGDTYETCYRMYKKTTSIVHNESGKPLGYGTEYEHIGMYERLY